MRYKSSLLALILGLGIYGVAPIVTKFDPIGAATAEAKVKAKPPIHHAGTSGGDDNAGSDNSGDDNGDNNDGSDGNDDGNNNDSGGDNGHDGGGHDGKGGGGSGD